MNYRNEIITGDARELAKSIPDNSIDLIFTDPPYLEEYLSLYGWLSEEANRVLKPDGFLLTYTGNLWKQQAMMQLGQHLSFFWDFIILHPGSSQLLVHRFITANYKSILCFVKKRSGQPRPRRTVNGLWTSPKMDKRFHLWGQEETTARYYIDCFSSPGDTIWEPFCGGGTTPAVCKQLGRNFIGFEIDATTAEIARERIKTVQPLLMPEEVQYTNLWEDESVAV
jgi:site-specific DNA-methyltransferase (adenine-specific)